MGMRTGRVGVATLVLALMSRTNALLQRSSDEQDGDLHCDPLCPTWTQYSFEERCVWHKCKGCDGCTGDSHDISDAKKDEKDRGHSGPYEVHLQRFDEVKPAKVKASPEFRTTYSIAGEAERRVQERLSEKMDDTNKEPLEVSKPEKSWHEKGEA